MEKDIYILSIESSCDETAVAILKNEKQVLANVVSSQIKNHETFGGVIPELASRLHVDNIAIVLNEALEKAGVTMAQIDAIAFCQAPGLIGSLHVGVQAAKTLAFYHNKPLIPVHHIAGHIYACNLVDDFKFPVLSVVVSGGHTQLVLMKDHLDYTILGQTHDDAVGEAYDKVAKVLGLGYPGGPIIDRLAKEGKHSYQLPTPMDDASYDFSYSGLKSAVINLIHNHKQKGQAIIPEDIACSFQEVAIGIIIKKALKAYEEFKPQTVLIAGGVAANSYLRNEMTKAFEDKCHLILPPFWCCTDNAIMIGAVGYHKFLKKQFCDLTIGPKPNLEL